MFKKKNITFLFKLLTVMFVLTAAYTVNTAHAEAKNYTVKVSTKPCNKSYTKASSYTKKTKQYYMLRSYLEKLEKEPQVDHFPFPPFRARESASPATPARTT